MIHDSLRDTIFASMTYVCTVQGEKIKMITVDLLVEGGIFALLQHGLYPTF